MIMDVSCYPNRDMVAKVLPVGLRMLALIVCWKGGGSFLFGPMLASTCMLFIKVRPWWTKLARLQGPSPTRMQIQLYSFSTLAHTHRVTRTSACTTGATLKTN